jgi:hypothetical protein
MEDIPVFEQKEIHDGDAVQSVPECHLCAIPERRKKPRVDCGYPAIVEGTDRQGNWYKENAKLENLSAGGLYM